MAEGKQVRKVFEAKVPPAPPSAESGRVEVNPGNVPLLTVQLLNDINIKLGKILEKMNG